MWVRVLTALFALHGGAGAAFAQAQHAETSSDADDLEVIEVRSGGRSLSGPPEAVTEVDFEQYRFEAADLGQLLNRQQGVNLRRTGGLGSNIRFSLNGLTGNQVRFFVDGVPLELAGLGTGIADIPPSLVDELAIYRGVVPARLGADALGGAIELRTEGGVVRPGARVNYLLGSFGTHRASASAALPLGDDGFFVRAFGFFDRTDNDYRSLQEVADFDTGLVETRRVRRFHDAYQAYGASVLGGWADHPVLGTVTVRAFVNGLERDIQQGFSTGSDRPFGEAERSEFSVGGVGRFDFSFGDRVRWFGTVGGAHLESTLFDVGACAYTWLGDCNPIRLSGELDPGLPSDATQVTDAGYLRTTFEVEIAEGHHLRLSFAPTYSSVGGEERAGESGAVLGRGSTVDAQRELLSSVVGLDYELETLDGRLGLLAFGKWYLLDGQSETLDELDEAIRDISTSNFGGGSVVRFGVVGSIELQASYEYALRLPAPAEFFGTVGLILPNLDLRPERSHNVNAGVRLRPWTTPLGGFRGEVNGFFRDSEDLIQLVSAFELVTHQNISAAQSIGVETLLGWTSPGRYLSLDGSFTYMDFRNTSMSGEEAAFNGDRIRNTPYLFGSGTARFRLTSIVAKEDQFELSWTSRYTKSFFLTWESIGRADTKFRVEDQLESSLNLSYQFTFLDQRFGIAFDIQNITDEDLFDFFGIQRPTRAFYVRVSVELAP